ncbi:MAG: SAM-dependent chlorinase/fluorinase [Methanothrix sp.]|nr:SAM-dependent chlorinase/fluorinase [Methanothrix sp.]
MKSAKHEDHNAAHRLLPLLPCPDELSTAGTSSRRSPPALLSSGQSPAGMGPRVRSKDLNFGEAKKMDRFGNLILKLRKLPAFPVSLKGIRLKRVRTYAQARRIEPLITQGSHGFAEIAVNGGDLSCSELSLCPMNRS